MSSHSIRTTLLPRGILPGIVLTEEVLEKSAALWRELGSITILVGSGGDAHEAILTDIEVTERGVEVTLGLEQAVFNQIIATMKQPAVSMGCIVKESTCPICDGDKGECSACGG